MTHHCALDPTLTSTFPFEYKGHDGKPVTAGTLVQGVCILNNTACSLSVNCCGLTDGANHATSKLWLIPMVCFIAPFYLFNAAKNKTRKAEEENRKAEGLEPEESKHPMALMMAGWSSSQKTAFKAIFLLALAATIAEAVVMPKSIQNTLQPPDTAALLAMTSFLTPVEEVFAFIEDVMIVEVGYAVASGQHKRLNLLLNISVLGGVASALLAFSLMVVIAFNKGSAEAFLNPSSAQNQDLINSGCDLISTGDELLGVARVYWLLSAAAWIPKFAIKGLFGFFIGTGYLGAYVAPMIISAGVPLVIWFTLKGTMPPLSVVGLAYGTADWALAVLFFAFLLSSKSMREKYELRWLGCSWLGDDKMSKTVKEVST
jgi:hypothetical protein